MVAQVKGGRLRRSFEPWPGYVDVLSTLLMVIIFVLLIFVVAQVFLGNALSGRDEELLQLRRQVQELNEMLGLERKTTQTLRGNVGDLSGELQASVSARDELERRLKVAEDERSAMAASLAQAQAELETLRQAKAALQQKLAESSDIATTRDALNLRLTTVIGERDALATKLSDAEGRVADLTAALGRKSDEAAQLAARGEALSRELESTRSQLAGTKDELAAAQQRAQTAEAALKETRDTLAATQGKLDETAASLTDTQAQLAEARRQAAALQDELAATRQQLAETQERLDHMTSRLVALQSAVAANDEALKAEREARAATEAKLAEAQKTIEADSGKVQALLGDIAVLQSLRDELEKKVLAAEQKGEAEVAAQKALTDEAQRQAELLNAQLLSLRNQLASVQQALGVRESEVESQRIEITELGRKLNAALVSKVKELERYRSEFFGRLRAVLGDRPDIEVVGDRFVFQSEVLFDSGSAEIGEDGKAQLAKFAKTLLEVAAKIPPDVDWMLRVDGHTDSRPINSPQFPSNWELSAARAIAVVKFLESQGIEPKRLAATGFGQFRPIAQGTDEESLRRNRRIELKLDQR